MDRKTMVGFVVLTLIAVSLGGRVARETGSSHPILDHQDPEAEPDYKPINETGESSYNVSRGNITHTAEPEDHEHKSMGGVIAGIIIGVLLLIVVVVGIIFFLYRYNRSRSSEYSRNTQVQISSTRNAGVYMDLTTEVPADGNTKNDEKLALKKQSDLYECDTDDY